MKKIISTLTWILRAWPVLFVIGILIVHLILLNYTNIDSVMMNSVIGQVLPLIGGVFVLISINESFQDFQNISMFTSLKNYFKSCPLKKQNYVLGASSIEMSVTFGKPTLMVKKKWNSTEEGLNELERRIEDLRKFIGEVSKSNAEDHTRIFSEVNILAGKNHQEIQQVSNRLDKSVLGNVKYQVFGILLIVYGFILNIMLIFQF